MAARYAARPEADERPPAFTQRPRDQTAGEGGSVYFAVAVEGQPRPDLSWHFRGRTLRDEGRHELYTEKDVSFLEIFELCPADAGVYTCRLANKAGRVSAMAELKVTGKSALSITNEGQIALTYSNEAAASGKPEVCRF